ncbi:sensor histidine kinase [Mucilaginibacter sp. UR6-11]|uniref:sensor histidine kinase n=1 Tax=Mucilaginibacter sp. UR6-11 TaxID=1435644 RepID=UPI001E65DAC8|nr:histidine kinase [Mucilaginibacter sp. UR6-11]MCC8426529.1 histidine kinase [Mucilaginibacter sp. UR6-11]
MNFIKNMAITTRLQWLIWIAVFLILFFSVLPMDGWIYAFIFAPVSVAFYLLVIYGNILVLFPRFYLTGRKVQYVIYVIIMLVGGGLARGYTTHYLYNKLIATKPMTMAASDLIYVIVTGFLTFLLSFIFRIAIAYFDLKQQSEKIMAQKSQAELDLLKSQVQPHFLFNTLNNIYYEAYREAPTTAKLIERLSDIMRYFVDESPKDQVAITTEIQFLENYIALEKIRMRHDLDLAFVQACNSELRIPPMLLMTFVENIFKHGIDKSSSDNKIELSLIQDDSYLVFETVNKIHPASATAETNGFGIKNLEKRLILLYGNTFELHTSKHNNFFTAYLKVPL